MEEKLEFMKDVIYQNRKKKHLTQEQLAAMLNVSNKTVSKWERGITYPDIQIIPSLAKILDIPIQALFNSADLKPENITKYNRMIIVKYKQKMMLSFILFLISPVFYLISSFVLNSYTFVVVSILIGAAMIIYSVTNVIMISIRMHDLIANNYKNEKYISVFKYNLLSYCFMIFILCSLLSMIFKSKVLAISMVTFVYTLFVLILLFVVGLLRINIKKIKNIFPLIISVFLFITGLILMICLNKIPYVLLYIFSQLINYLIVFVSTDINK